MDSSYSYKKSQSVDIDIDIDTDMDIESSQEDNDDEAELLYPTKSTNQHQESTKNNDHSHVGSSCLRKCLCVTLVLIGLLLTVAAIAGAFACKWFAGHLREWTVEEPHPLPTIYVSDKELGLFKDEAKLFLDQIQAGKIPKDLVVTQDIVNGFAAQSDFLRGNIFTEMKPNQITVTVSIPVDSLPGGKGRYLVGVETLTWDPAYGLLTAKMEGIDGNNDKIFNDFYFSLDQEKIPNGDRHDDGGGQERTKWNLEILSGELFDCCWTVPQEYKEKHENILEEFYHCDKNDDGCNKAHKILEALDGISLEDGQVVFHARSSGLNNVDDGDMANNGGHHRLLTEAAAEAVLLSSSNYNNKPPAGWKVQLVRRLMAF